MFADRWDFWIWIMKKLNLTDDLYTVVPEVLGELCDYFGFGCGFVYQSDHTDSFSLRDYYAVYSTQHIPQSFNLNTELNDEFYQQMIQNRSISFSGHTEKGDIDNVFADLFGAKSLVLFPVTDENRRIIAFVGIADRRGEIRYGERDMQFGHAVLSTLVNHIKLSLYQTRIELARNALSSIIDNMGAEIYVSDYNTHEVLFVNESLSETLGGSDALIGTRCWEHFFGSNMQECEFCPRSKLLNEKGEPGEVYAWDYQNKDTGDWLHILNAAFYWVDGRLAHVVSSINITENKQNEEIIRNMAEYDFLTQLPNRHRLAMDCDNILPTEGNDDWFVVFFDLDGFKIINDTMGHSIGDELLKAVGSRLQENKLTRDRSYRYGGDEFVILVPGSVPGGIKAVLQSLNDKFNEPVPLSNGERVLCRASLGIAHYPKDDTLSSELMRKADAAMYVAKNNGRGQVRFYNNGDCCTPEEYYSKIENL